MKPVEILKELIKFPTYQVAPGRFRMGDFEGEMPINVALIEGGRAMNIVPGECKTTCERRVLPNEKPEQITQSIRSTLESLRDVNMKCEFSPNVQLPYIVGKEEEVVELAVRASERVAGYRPQLRVGLGRTDSMYLYHMAGIKTVIMGSRAHRPCRWGKHQHRIG